MLLLVSLIALVTGAMAQAPVAAGQAATGGGNSTRDWPSPPLPAGPSVFETWLQPRIRVFVTKGLEQPWSMAFLPDGGILITERPGRLRIVRNGVLAAEPIAGVPAVKNSGTNKLVTK